MENIREIKLDDAAKVLGEQVKTMRQLRDWTQVELAENLKEYGLSFSQGMVAKLESGKRPTTVQELTALAQVFGVEPADLLTNHDLPEGFVYYAEASREEYQARLNLESATRDYLQAQERLADAADHADITDKFVSTKAIAGSLASTPEYIVMKARQYYERLQKAVDEVHDYGDDRLPKMSDLPAEAREAFDRYLEADDDERSFTQILKERYGVDSEEA